MFFLFFFLKNIIRTVFLILEATMNAFVILSVLVASCYAGYDKKQVGGPYPGPYPLPGNHQVAFISSGIAYHQRIISEEVNEIS